MSKIICLFKGHKWKELTSLFGDRKDYVCTRCGKTERKINW